MVFHGRYLEIHPFGTEYISRSCTQHQGGGCSTWEGGEAQKGVLDKESIKDPPLATLGRAGYVGKRLGQADREMARMFGLYRFDTQ